MDCNKIKFYCAEDAEQELRRIVEGNDYRVWKQVSPKRFYKCPLHGKEEIWHLTSSINIIPFP